MWRVSSECEEEMMGKSGSQDLCKRTRGHPTVRLSTWSANWAGFCLFHFHSGMRRCMWIFEQWHINEHTLKEIPPGEVEPRASVEHVGEGLIWQPTSWNLPSTVITKTRIVSTCPIFASSQRPPGWQRIQGCLYKNENLFIWNEKLNSSASTCEEVKCYW